MLSLASSISRAILHLRSPTPVPQDRNELEAAVDTAVKGVLSDNDPYNWIAWWDVRRVSNMKALFAENRRGPDVLSFNADISRWDVSRVTTMHEMFMGAKSFNADISKWDVSRVTDMTRMFSMASRFSQTLSGAWTTSKAVKVGMFYGTLYQAYIVGQQGKYRGTNF